MVQEIVLSVAGMKIMKKLLALLIALFAIPCFAGVLSPPMDRVYETSKGNVTFLHSTHNEQVMGCSTCHTKLGHFPSNKEMGHKYCRVCHINEEVYTLCTDCHKRGE